MNEVLRCAACGGAVVWDAEQSSAACLFCATPALEIVPDAPPTPDLHLPAKIGEVAASMQFRAWATKSWFRPKQLRATQFSLQPLLLPAWRVEARLETHWAGLRRASTRSGRAPVAGVERIELTHMIPASSGLRADELVRLLPFDETTAGAWAGSGPGSADEAGAAGETLVWEPPALSRRGALARARRELEARHQRRIVASGGLLSAKVSTIIEERDVGLLLLPIYIGSFRFRDRPWRFLVNAQTGVVVGEAPLDRRKVALVVSVALLLAGLMLLWWGGSAS